MDNPLVTLPAFDHVAEWQVRNRGVTASGKREVRQQMIIGIGLAGATVFFLHPGADRACALDPLCFVVTSAAAHVHYLRGDYEAAIPRYRQVLTMEPRHVTARRGLASCLVQLGQIDEALNMLTSHEKIRQDPVAKAWMGHALAVSGSTAAAKAIASELQSAQVRRIVPPFHLAVLFAGLGNLDAAFPFLYGLLLLVGKNDLLSHWRLSPCNANLKAT